MNYIFAINKSKGVTSRDVVNDVMKELKINKVGHAGTLDPLATGVLIICVGQYTKLVDLITNQNKEYIAEVLLGINTDTLDIMGNITDEKNVNITREQIEKVLSKFKGKITQEVPLYSAIKIKGKRLYEYARNDMEVILPKREVEIFNIELISDIYDNKFKIKCEVSKGTYIRSLVRDIGKELNTYAIVNNLERTKQGNIKIEDCIIDLNNIKNISIERILQLKKIIVDENLEKKISNGIILDRFFKDDLALIYNNKDEFIAIYKTYKKNNNKVKPLKVFKNS